MLTVDSIARAGSSGRKRDIMMSIEEREWGVDPRAGDSFEELSQRSIKGGVDQPLRFSVTSNWLLVRTRYESAVCKGLAAQASRENPSYCNGQRRPSPEYLEEPPTFSCGERFHREPE